MISFLSSKPKIILGSASSSRKKIMDDLASQYGFNYTVKTADIDEKAIRFQDPHQLVLALGHAKRDAILSKLAAETSTSGSISSSEDHNTNAYLITCDQVVVHGGRILEKPENENECREFIRGYGESPASTVGSVVCTSLSTGRSYEEVDVSHIHIATIPEEVITKLVEEGACMWCAGGLMIEHPLVSPYIQKIEGTEDGVRGLSKALVTKLLLEAQGHERSLSF
ncbi:hypothetical protein CEUSTIGMA_g3500.t1 [Chlamydomonas eustigma]|uniref:Maf-like protein n=1 Tax=Chlamydomonas eustigma TaxID=1157962 RepID=A0A250WYZ0_9CHLO|nr:hypothetical protein CEUSTIGMA_g3500.t1 [Chlamydomonas eustigma]|eukprot:GAX76057.1 hypothetical protein CEUSTIGMA_g3500.t1 [Chlamydomonas eustigma]